MERTYSKKIVIDVTPEEHLEFKKAVVSRGDTMKGVLMNCIETYIEEAKRAEKKETR